MIDTTDLTSYIPGYDEYCEPKEDVVYEDNSDFERDYLWFRKEEEKMRRDVIDLNTTCLTFNEIMNLDDYIWKNDKLIPSEMIEGD